MTIESHSTHAENAGDPMDAVADLLMGGDAEGDSNTVTPNEDPDPQQSTEASDDTEELSDETTEGGESDDESEESDGTEAPEDEESLAKMLGLKEEQLTVNDDGSVLINTKVDGKMQQVSLQDVVKISQTEASLTNKSMAFAEERKAFEAAAQAQAQELYNTLQQGQQLTNMLEQDLLSEFKAVDWDQLRQYDPAEWSAKRQEFATKYGQVKKARDTVDAQMGQQAQQAQSAFVQSQQQHLQGQRETVLANNPTWGDDAVYKQHMGALKDFATGTYGFTEQDMNNVSDARLIELMKDAMAYRNAQGAANKKIKQVPKMQKRKGGRRKGSKVSKLEKLTRAAKAATGSNKRRAQTDAVAELLIGGN